MGIDGNVENVSICWMVTSSIQMMLGWGELLYSHITLVILDMVYDSMYT